MTNIVSPSILSSDFLNLETEINKIISSGTNWIHLDIMDGHYVPNLTIGPPIIQSIRRKFPKVILDVHLMISNTEQVIDSYIKTNCDYLTFHVEPVFHHHRLIHQIKDAGIKAGIALNPATPLSSIEQCLPLMDLVLIMSVNPGFGGQTFINSSLEKITDLKQKVQKLNTNTLISVDGGVCSKNAKDLVYSGADILVAGNAVFSSNDYSKAILDLKVDTK